MTKKKKSRSSSSLKVVKNKCSECGACESESIKLLSCAQCVAEKNIKTVYCSRACQVKAWKSRHKAFHQIKNPVYRENVMAVRNKFLADKMGFSAAHSQLLLSKGDPKASRCRQLILKGVQFNINGDFKKAGKKITFLLGCKMTKSSSSFSDVP